MLSSETIRQGPYAVTFHTWQKEDASQVWQAILTGPIRGGRCDVTEALTALVGWDADRDQLKQAAREYIEMEEREDAVLHERFAR
ncbi:MAG TPA: hypothetical protein VKU00_19260 [Chthonomonadaceae bacterium]|nr:hypothetical protein [Chthonomonadaceae bacterium]